MFLGGCFFMRTIVLIDGQNLFHLARTAWSSGPSSPYDWPSYDVEKLAHALVSRAPGRTLAEVRFYTGVPDPSVGPRQLFWHDFWSNKIGYLKSRGIHVYRGRVSAARQEKWRRCQPGRGFGACHLRTAVRSRDDRQSGFGLRTRRALGKGDRSGAGSGTHLRILLPVWSWGFTERGSGNDVGSDRQGDLRRLS